MSLVHVEEKENVSLDGKAIHQRRIAGQARLFRW
jgi:hypothetical protein